MASVEIEIDSRKYAVACRDGEEPHLRSVAAIVDRKARDAAGALGGLGESRQLPYAELLLADEFTERRAGGGGTVEASAQPQARSATRAQHGATKEVHISLPAHA